MNKTTKNILYTIVAIIVIALIAYPKIPKNETVAAESDSKEATKLTLDAVVVKKEKLENQVNVTGTLLADESVMLNPEVAGKVQEVLFDEGQYVHKGETLLKLNDSEILAELEKLQYTKELNENNEYRQKQLLEREGISQAEYETTQTALKTTIADIKMLQSRLNKHYIKAPFDGVIGLRDVSEGSYLSVGQRVAVLYKINPIKLEFMIPSKYIRLVNKGDKLSFSVDAYEENFYGEIYAIEPQIDPETRSIRLRAKANNPEGKLYPGQFARITLILETIPDAIMVPTEAVIPELNGKKVYKYVDGKVESTQITSNIRTENRLQVTSGLNVGDTVITSGILQIGLGMEVNVNIK